MMKQKVNATICAATVAEKKTCTQEDFVKLDCWGYIFKKHVVFGTAYTNIKFKAERKILVV